MADVALRGLPDELHRALKEAAERNRRSLNGEILTRLEASIHPKTVDVEGLLARIRSRRERTNLPALDDRMLRQLKDSGRQ